MGKAKTEDGGVVDIKNHDRKPKIDVVLGNDKKQNNNERKSTHTPFFRPARLLLCELGLSMFPVALTERRMKGTNHGRPSVSQSGIQPFPSHKFPYRPNWIPLLMVTQNKGWDKDKTRKGETPMRDKEDASVAEKKKESDA